MDTAVLEFRQVTKRFVSHTAVDGISLAIGRGAFFSLLGPSGCGKTTTLRLAAGFEQPDSGDVFLSGVRINNMRPYERNVSTVFQNYALFPHLTVRGNIEFGLRRRRATAIQDAVRNVIDLVQLAGKESRKPSEISGGEKQRVALARSLVLAPDVLLLDEPLSALDPNLRKQMRAELKSVQRRVGIAFLFVTHDQEEALSLSDRIAVMNNGRIEQTGSPRELYLRPATRFVAGFLGAMNWYNGIGIRPESTCVGRSQPVENGARAFPARVEEAVFLGNCLHIETRLASGERIISEVPRASEAYAAGDDVHVWWRPEDELRFPLENQ
jgi:ABC-type Fe3+/spermidine/putrescine transport system ATPase subunit